MTPRYGFDAPGIMQGMLAAGVAGIIAGAAIAALSPYGAALAVAALVPFALGTSMLAYGLIGKLRIRDAILRGIPWRGDERVLDIGTGRGLLLVGAARRLTTGRATGIDIFRAQDLSGNTMAALRANIAAEGVTDRAEGVEADARALPFPDRHFDVVLSMYCIHNIDPQADQDRALAEAFRVLKPGGRMVLGEWLPTHRYAGVLVTLGATGVITRTAFATALAPMWLTECSR